MLWQLTRTCASATVHYGEGAEDEVSVVVCRGCVDGRAVVLHDL